MVPGLNFQTIKEYLGKPLVSTVLGFILGLIIGLPVLGWGLFPVVWVDASPQQLRSDLKLDYLRMAIDSYSKNQNAQLAKQRFSELGSEGATLLDQIKMDPTINSKDYQAFTKKIEMPFTQSIPLQPETKTAKATDTGGEAKVAATSSPESQNQAVVTETPITAETTLPKPGIDPRILFGVFCGLTLVIGIVLVYLLFLKNRIKMSGLSASSTTNSDALSKGAVVGSYPRDPQEAPFAHFMTTYMLGDDLYDDSFSIDSPTGEFLGECGVGVSDTIGAGDPKKVTAFDVWLFDKNDIQTGTKVLMSEFALNDPSISQRLLTKGEPVLMEAGKSITLETATLQLEVRIVDINYGQGDSPEKSFFDRMTLELSIWPKAGG
jgi:hypothetical protein